MPAEQVIEQKRIEELYRFRILDTEPDDRFDRVCRLAADIFRVPIAIVTLVDTNRIWLKSSIGMGDASEIPRDQSFCDVTIKGRDTLIVEDATKNPLFSSNPLVTAADGVRFYAGVPLLVGDGHALGSLCILDYQPRQADDRMVTVLEELAEIVADLLIQHRAAVNFDRQKQVSDLAEASAESRRAELEAASNLRESVLEVAMDSFMKLEALRDDSGEIVDFLIADVNKSALRFTRLERENIVGKRLFDTFPNASETDVLSVYAKVIDTGVPTRFELQHKVTTGADHWFRVTAIKSGDGVAITYSDITELRNQQEELKRLNAVLAAERSNFRTLFRHSPAMVYSMNTARQMVDASDRLFERLGYSREEMIGRKLANFLSPSSLRRAETDILPRFWRIGHVMDEPYEFITKNGETVEFELSAVMEEFPEPGQEPSIHVAMVDVTERNRAKYEISKREHDYRFLVNGIPDLLTRALPDTTLFFVNDRFARFIGKTPAQLRGQVAADLAAKNDKEMILANLAQCTPENPTVTFETKSVDSLGHRQWVQWSNTMLFSADGEPYEILSIGRNVTAVHEAHAEIRAQSRAVAEINTDLARANENLRQFAYIASHDLQEPLRKIRSFGELLVEAIGENNQEDVQYSIGVMTDASERASLLVKDLLTYSRTSNREYGRAVVDLRALSEMVLSNLSLAVNESGAAIDLDFSHQNVTGDRTAIEQMLQNLLSNAIKYRHPERQPRIAIRFNKLSDGSGRLEIGDNGIGFDSSFSAQVFEPFKRLHTRTDYPGTGIGLAICARVSERLNWGLRAESEEDVGSTFIIDIPERDMNA